MKCGVLFSGGKDSGLASLMLSRYYEVELNTFVFDEGQVKDTIREAAEFIGLPHQVRILGKEILNRATEMVLSDGFPNNAINMVHCEALERLAGLYPVIADGTRYGDRVPFLTHDNVQRLSSRYGISYIRPLLGFPKTEVLRLANREVVITYGETGDMDNGDYEGEIRNAIRMRGFDPSRFFPSMHQQSLVTGKAGTSGVST